MRRPLMWGEFPPDPTPEEELLDRAIDQLQRLLGDLQKHRGWIMPTGELAEGDLWRLARRVIFWEYFLMERVDELRRLRHGSIH